MLFCIKLSIFAKKYILSFRNKLLFFLVRNLQISNNEARTLLIDGQVAVDSVVTSANLEIEPEQEIRINGTVIRPGKKFKYIAFYKPRGIETTLNKDIKDNLSTILPFEDVFHVGRLDKASEGLLVLSDDGRIYDKILRNEHKMEKEYIVRLDKPFDDLFIETMQKGVTIMGKMTLPCILFVIDSQSFKIILVQGLNRQIRRMCYKLGYDVVSLCRVRIGNLRLGNLEPGNWRFFEREEIY